MRGRAARVVQTTTAWWHIDVLLQAHTLGLVDDIGLQRVVSSACNDLRWARARYASQTGINWDRVIQQLNKDIIAANDFLPDDKQVDTHAHTERLPHNAAAAVAILVLCVGTHTLPDMAGHATYSLSGHATYSLSRGFPSKLHDTFWGVP